MTSRVDGYLFVLLVPLVRCLLILSALISSHVSALLPSPAQPCVVPPIANTNSHRICNSYINNRSSINNIYNDRQYRRQQQFFFASRPSSELFSTGSHSTHDNMRLGHRSGNHKFNSFTLLASDVGRIHVESRLQKLPTKAQIVEVFRRRLASLSIGTRGLYLLYPLLSFASGLATGYSIAICKQWISGIDQTLRKPHPLLSPLIGSIAVSMLYFIHSYLDRRECPTPTPDLSKVGPEINFLIYNNAGDGHQGLGVPSTVSLLSVRRRQFLRAAAVVIAIGTGNAVAFTGMAAELGLLVSSSIISLLDCLPIRWHDATSTSTSTSMSMSTLKDWLLLAGAAAGVSANFDAPMTGSIYAYEVASRLIPAKRRVDTATTDNFPGLQTMCLLTASFAAVFIVRGFHLSSPMEMLHVFSKQVYYAFPKASTAAPFASFSSFAILGLLCGWLSHYFNTSLRPFLASASSRLISSPNLRPLFGGMINSLAILATGRQDSQSLAEGYQFTHALLQGRDSFLGLTLSSHRIAVHFFVKALSLAACLSSGLLGGAVAPALFLGGDLGFLLHAAVTNLQSLLPSINRWVLWETLIMKWIPLSSGSSYVVAGAAAVLAGMMKAPLTAVALSLELTRSLDVSLPVMVAVAASLLAGNLLSLHGNKSKTTGS